MKVVQLIPTLSVGGAEVMVSMLARELRQLGHDVAVIALGKPADSWIEDRLREQGIEVRFLGKGAGLDPRTPARLARALRELQPDVVHSHLHVLKYLMPAKVAWRGPVVHTLHNLAEHEATRADRMLQQVAFRRNVWPVAIGDAVADSTVAVYGMQPAAVIPNGIEVMRMRGTPEVRAEVRRELDIDADTPLFVVVGRLMEQKNHAGLLEAFADDRLRELGAQLLIVGDGHLRSEVEAAAEPLGPRVRLLGIRRDVPRLLAAADAFVLASHFEGNPLVVMEAMAAERAVVATSVGCVPELVDGESGRLVAAGDMKALADALVELAGDRALAAELGRHAGERALTHFDVTVMAARYDELYRSLLSERS